MNPKFLFLALVASFIFSAASIAGGIDGGGGGTLPAISIGQSDVIYILRNSKRDLRMLIKAELWGNNLTSHSNDLDKRLYGGEKTLLDVLESADLEILTDRPCQDAFGNPVDGSVHASKPNTICISAFTIAPKLIEERARTEILALVMHELSHLLGASEKEAVSLQQSVAYALRKTDEKTAYEMSAKLGDLASQVRSSLDRVFKASSNDKDLEELEKVSLLISDFQSLTMNLPFALFDHKEYDLHSLQSARLMLVEWYAKFGTPKEHFFKEDYEKLFAGGDAITFNEFEERHHGIRIHKNRYGKELIRKISSRDEFLRQVKELVDYFSEVSELAHAFEFDYPLPVMSFPTQTKSENPWEQFKGQYEITFMECQDGKEWPATRGDTAFLIHRPDYNPSDLYLRVIQDSGWGDNHLANNAHDVSGGIVRIAGGGNFAERIVESGSLWGDRWHRVVTKMTRDGSTFRMTISSRFRNQFLGDKREVSNECHYLLKKI